MSTARTSSIPHRPNWGIAVGRFHSAVCDSAVGPIIVAIVALMPRLSLLLSRSALYWQDSEGYYLSATGMLERHTLLSSQIFHSPLYPLFIASFIAHGETPQAGLAIVGAQHLFGFLTVMFSYYAARRVFGGTIAFYAALLLALHPLLLYYECVIQTEILFSFLLSGTLALTLRAIGNRSTLTFALAGVCCGLGALTRPVAQQYLVAVIIVLFIAQWDWRRSLRNALPLLLAYLSVVCPFMYGNLRYNGYWGLSHGEGLNLVLRAFDLDHLPPPKQTKYPDLLALYERTITVKHQIYALFNKRLKRELGYTPIEADEKMFGFALEAVKAHPFAFIGYSAVDFVKFFASAKNSPRLCSIERRARECIGVGDLPRAFRYRPSRGRSRLSFLFSDDFYALRPFNWVTAVICLIGMVTFTLKAFRARFSGPAFAYALLLDMTLLYFGAVTAAFDRPWDRFRLPVDPILYMYFIVGAQFLLAFALQRTAKGNSPATEDRLPQAEDYQNQQRKRSAG